MLYTPPYFSTFYQITIDPYSSLNSYFKPAYFKPSYFKRACFPEITFKKFCVMML